MNHILFGVSMLIELLVGIFQVYKELCADFSEFKRR